MIPSKTLKVQGAGFTAVALWAKDGPGWRCVEAPPVLGWMKGLEPAAAKAGLESRAWPYTWH